MHCTTVQKLLPLYIGADLDARRQADVSAHVRSCLSCARSLKGYKQALGAYRSIVLNGVDSAGDPALLVDPAANCATQRPSSRGPVGAPEAVEPTPSSLWDRISAQIAAEQLHPEPPRFRRIHGQMIRLVAAGILLALSVFGLSWRLYERHREQAPVVLPGIHQILRYPRTPGVDSADWRRGPDRSPQEHESFRQPDQRVRENPNF